MRCLKSIGKGSVILLTAVFVWGCATSLVDRKVSLYYEGPKPINITDNSGQEFREILVAPFVDIRKNKNSFGTYDWGRLSVNYISTPGSVAEAITHLTVGFLQKAGMRTVNGKWDGTLATLPDVPTENALYGEIELLDFSGRGRFYNAEKSGIVRLNIKWGNKSTRKIITRTVEITPDRQDWHILQSSYDHVARMEDVIRKAINRALWEAMSTMFRNAGNRG